MPIAGQKGTNKKTGRDVRQSRSRNTTPSAVGATTTAFLELPLKDFRTFTYEELAGTLTPTTIPDYKSLKSLQERLDQYAEVVKARSATANRGMRLLASTRPERFADDEGSRRHDRKDRARGEGEEDDKNRLASKLKKRREARSKDGHGLGVDGVDQSNPSTPVPKKHGRRTSRDSASSSLTPVEGQTPTANAAANAAAENRAADSMDVDDSSSDEEPPKPPPPPKQTFGDDPSTFPDPTVYEIREVKPGMSEEEIKEIYSVAVYPHNDLSDLIPGTPPDKDFSTAKPTNQVQASTFDTYLQPFFRPFNDEDLAFLRERGDRVTPFVIPRRAKKHYTDVWAEEDGGMSIDTPTQGRDKLPANQGRGTVESMDDSVAETDQISGGPLLSRLMATFRPEHRATADDRNGLTNGDANGDANGDDGPSQTAEDGKSIPPATFMPDSNTEAWKKATHPRLDHAQIDERIKQELRYIGFFIADTEPDFDAQLDDDVAARLRFLQSKLREVSIRNGARKARIAELVKERMAHQEYTTILEDLDTQVQQAYLKRTRTMGKSKKAKRPGGAGGGSHYVGNGASGMARPAIGDNTKLLMSRRRDWMDTISPIFEDERKLCRVPRSKDPDSSIFKPEDLKEYITQEKNSWDDGDGEDEE